jgi:integrase
MGTVYRKTITRPLPADAIQFTKQGVRFVRWKPQKGRTRTARLVDVPGGSPRIRTESATFTAKYRDGNGFVREVATGCRDEDAARSVLRDLERRAELVRAGVITNSEDSISDQQSVELGEHFTSYIAHLQAKGAGKTHRETTRRNLQRLANECGWKTLRNLTRQGIESWLVRQTDAGMSARSRNASLSSVVAFGNWCVDSGRLLINPFFRLQKANEKADPRRKRRALTPNELIRLLQVVRWRPLAEYGREPIATTHENPNQPRKRANWKRAELAFDGLADAVESAKQALRNNPHFVDELDRLGRERALILKTLVLTGLRRSELASMTIGQVVLDGSLPCLILNAADEKNRQGSMIPLRADLVEDLRVWLADASKSKLGESHDEPKSRKPVSYTHLRAHET